MASVFKQRRVVLLFGARGIGKSSLCREFCYHYSAPGGRLFSSCALHLDRGALGPRCTAVPLHGSEGALDFFLDAFAQAALAQMAARSPLEPQAPGEASDRPWDVLLARARRLDELGPWLLVLDGLGLPEQGSNSGEEEMLAQALEGLLGCTARLRLLLTSRSRPRGRWAALGASKVVGLELAPLSLRDAALLFARRVRRPLYAQDFSTAESEVLRGGQPLPGGVLLDRLAQSALLGSLGGVPGRIAEAAAEVDHALPSLLRHSALLSPTLAGPGRGKGRSEAGPGGTGQRGPSG